MSFEVPPIPLALDIPALYNALAAGEEITILISSLELPNFKTKLYRVKKLQEDQLVGLEIMAEKEIKQLTFQFKPHVIQEPDQEQDQQVELLEVTMKLVPRPRHTTYTIIKRTPLNAT